MSDYWEIANRLKALESAFRKPRYVICIPCGRRRFLELLMPHVIKSKLADEIHLWYNPRCNEDSDYIRKNMLSLDSRIKIVDRPGNLPPRWSIDEFYPGESDENSIYLKIDDDVVWFEEGGIDKVFKFRKDNLQYFLVSPLVINNGFGACMLDSKIPFTDKEMEYVITGRNHSCICNANNWHTNSNLAIKVHNFFLDNANDIDKLHVPGQILSWIRLSINAISWFGLDMKNIKWDGAVDDEQFLSCDFPHHVGLDNYMMGDVICCHYAFGPQIDEVDKTDILERYRKLKV